ncbi:putative TetR family transcriptional regulator [uncultured Mycobacterium sp.]|uniref:Putative TetR family transcriptional regulator n=1 Tax=uncultured Mycobacterium sp. TaxID=171292 RepID=A0A1Y5P4N9_9MYCO|nr:putative TetR family transcriptional regulator [uncultured Mycobacterium sp.]
MTASTRTRRGPSPPPADAERGSLLDAGLALLTEQGVTSLTLAAILDRAGLGTRAFYRHFASKDEFVLAVWLRETEEAVRRLRRQTDRAASGHDGVMAWIDDRLRAAFASPRSATFEALWRYGFWLRSAYPTQFDAVANPQVLVLAEAIDRGLRDGSISTADPDLDASTIHAAFWMLAARHINGGQMTRRRARLQLIRIVEGLFSAAE